ncbi:MAG: hypothetical protein KJ908_09680 [Acidobacteria bacterium]|nr:hypothetical protein [Acidobacteriota bacterium]
MFHFGLIRNNPRGAFFLFFLFFSHFLFSHPGSAADHPSEHSHSKPSNPGDSSSSEIRSVRAIFLQAPVVIDGILDEEVWQSPGYTGFRQSDPIDGDPATEKTEVRIAYDTRNLYIAARMFDSDPDGIVGRWKSASPLNSFTSGSRRAPLGGSIFSGPSSVKTKMPSSPGSRKRRAAMSPASLN